MSLQKFYKDELPRLKKEKKELLQEIRCRNYEMKCLTKRLNKLNNKIKIREKYETR